ncbi:VOC family protein [Halobellus sp. GM3]|uniref:VOC family protein n=1 Tax=Halobellus sp. GM3 TaxID=3458410 RepID=UPI00403DC3F5
MDPNETSIRVDHVGVAVESVDEAEPVLTALGCEKVVDDTVEDRFRWVYYRLGGASRIELIEPVAEESFLTEYLDRHGPGLHHVTLEVADIDAVIDSLGGVGVDTIDRQSYEGWTEAFVSPRNETGVLFQLMEYTGAFTDGREFDEESFFMRGRRLSAGE